MLLCSRRCGRALAIAARQNSALPGTACGAWAYFSAWTATKSHQLSEEPTTVPSFAVSLIKPSNRLELMVCAGTWYTFGATGLARKGLSTCCGTYSLADRSTQGSGVERYVT
jgi:hypothetical protein